MVDGLKAGGSSATGGLSRCRGDLHGSVSHWMAPLLLLGLLWGTGNHAYRAQEKLKEKPLFLVARPTIEDPFFEKSVVLMVPLTEEQVIVGIVVNKPTRLPLSQLFPNNAALKNRSENAYMGGPVDMSVPALIFHSAKSPKQAIPIYNDVYLTFDGKLIMKQLEDPKPAGDMRVFLGRAQWAPAQLDGEALEGSWYSLRVEGDVIFDHDSEHLWKRLHDRARPPQNVKFRLPDRSRGRAQIAPTGFDALLAPPFPAPGFETMESLILWTAHTLVAPAR
jgi:putative transcriptional regulator